MSDVRSLSTEDLLARMDESPVRAVTLRGEMSVRAWLQEFGITPGRAIGPITSDLYRHYTKWCKEQGHKATNGTSLGKILTKFGFYQARRWQNYREYRPYKINGEAALYFSHWLDANPEPPGSRIASPNPRRREALKAAGIPS